MPNAGIRKTWLVAAREYVENLRTKTFWIGIFSLPVILSLSILVPMWLEEVKDVRRYAVLDQSGWLLEALEERAAYQDLLNLLEFLRDQAESPDDLAALPEALAGMARLVAGASDDMLIAQARMGAALGKSMLDQGTVDPEALPEEIDMERARAQAGEVATWMLGLDPDQARKLGAGLKAGDFERVEIPAGKTGEAAEEWLKSELAREDGLFCYFVIGADPVASSEGCRYVSNNLTDTGLREWIAHLASEEVRARRFEREKLDRDLVRRIQEPLVFAEKQVAAGGQERAVETKDRARSFAPIAFTYILWIAVFTIAQMLLTNTIEEKSNRIIEVLLSSVSPLELMSGKILGIAMTGLTVVGAWVLSFFGVVKILPLFVAEAEIPFDLGDLVRDPLYLGSFIVYFLLGYLLYAAILVGFGSVCNSLKEAQNLMQPVFVLLLVPIFAMLPIGQDPNGTLAKVLSFIPTFTPFVMMNRAAGPPAAWEYVATTVILVVSIAVAFWMAAKVFRIGVLMTGKPPRLGEILRWIRTPVGSTPSAASASDAPSAGA